MRWEKGVVVRMIVCRKFIRRALFALVSLLLLACGAEQPSDELQGRMLLWHTWRNGDAAALNEVLATFNEIHPNVNIKQQQFTDAEELLTQFQVAADAGLGPDLIIASGQEVRRLADAHLLRPIDNAVDDTIIQRYDPAALDSLRYQNALYGLPVSMDTLVLYYDTALVEQPATTLDALLAEAAQGRIVAMTTNFTDAFWGVQAFGGSLFDDERRVILDRGGFANWLAWLKDARDAPGMLLDSNREVLRNRFIEDGVAYYIGYASEYSAIVEGTEEMPGKGEDAVGVAILPAGPTAGAAPFLSVQAFLFSEVSSDNQRQLALELAQFVTNAEQQSTLMRETGLTPANNRVRVNPRLNPVVAIFTAQARAAVPILNIPEMDAVFRFGGDAYTRVLEGLLEPAEASATVTAAINEANNIEALATNGARCGGVGTLYLGYLAGARRAAALDVVLDRLQRDCPLLIINPVPITLDPTTVALTGATNGVTNTVDAGTLDAVAADAISARLATALTADGRVDLLLAPHRWIPTLVAQEQLHDLSALLDAETLQRYRPMAVDAMRYGGGLYGLPMSVSLDVLYYNRTLVTEPARTLDELQQQAAAGIPIALDYTFRHSFWGIPAFGGQLLTEQGNLALDSGFVDWLNWLQSANANAGLTLLPDRSAVLARFLDGSSAYYVGGPEMWQQLQQELGADTVGIVRLPSGPAGDAGPLLTATGLLFSNRLTDSQMQTALTVANYLTSVESQTIFWQRADQIPTNIGLDIAADAPLAAAVEQARTAVLLANAPALDLVIQRGDSVYRAVLADAAEPTAAVAEFLRTINVAVGEPPNEQ
jgi:maltose-binding protein MalE